MKWVRQITGILTKEISIQYRSQLTLFSRLLVGPVISCATAGILYAGFFEKDRGLSLGGLNAGNYRARLILAFLAHTFLNGGYYHLFRRFIHEWNVGTLPLFWMAPLSRPLLLAGVGGVEFIRCGVLTLIGLFVLNSVSGVGILAMGQIVLLLVLLYSLSVTLGFLKTIVYMAHEGLGDLIDHAFLAFVFSACLYIPRALLPSFLQPFCDLNPAYHAFEILIGIGTGQSLRPPSFVAFLAGWLVVLSLTALVWSRLKPRVLERSFS